MKKHRFLYAALLLLSTLNFTACSSDDDKGDGKTDEKQGALSTPQLSCAIKTVSGSTKFLTSTTNNDDRSYRITHANGKVVSCTIGDDASDVYVWEGEKYVYHRYGDVTSTVLYFVNTDNHIVSTEETQGYLDGGVGRITRNFSYDANGHLIKIKNVFYPTEYGDREADPDDSKMTEEYTYRWSNGNLTQITMKRTDEYSPLLKRPAETATFDYKFTYGSDENSLLLFPSNGIFKGIDDLSHLTPVLTSAGYFGIGPVNLPTSYLTTFNGGSPTMTQCSVSLNSDGTIHSVSSGNAIVYTETYHYE